MIKTIDITGIKLDNYTVHESIMQLEKHMSENLFHTVAEVTMDTLLLAESDKRVRQALEALDDTIIADISILDATGKYTSQRRHEVENRTFFYELMKRLERNHKKVFLLGKTEDEITEIQIFLLEYFPRMQFAGKEAMENCVGELDAIVNEINAATPDTVISILPAPDQEYFLLDHRDKISAMLWYGMGNGKPVQKKSGILRAFFHALKKRRRTRSLEKRITSYEEQKEELK